MKRGVFEVPAMLFSFLFLILLFFSYLLFVDSFDFKDREFIEGMESRFDEKLLLSYLQTPVSFDMDGGTKEMEMIDLIVLWVEDKDKYEDVFLGESKKILDGMSYEFEHPKTENLRIKAYSAVIYRDIEDPFSIIGRAPSENYVPAHCIGSPHSCEIRASADLPLRDPNEDVKVVFWASQASKKSYNKPWWRI
tara:strand:+ start:587 stop:1165 length:579 start_codon:yes stop_codon:yes gene_type:complete